MCGNCMEPTEWEKEKKNHNAFAGAKFKKIQAFADALSDVINKQLISDDEISTYLKGFLDGYCETVHAIEGDVNE